jgi:hypothetical protein
LQQQTSGLGFWGASASIVRDKGIVKGLYAGALTSSVGSFFSSAMYFATYESMKTYWGRVLPDDMMGISASLAAVSGNAVSSLVFVPKEVLKQPLMYTYIHTYIHISD